MSFNSSVGILSVGTYLFLNRRDLISHVSIPQSEFCPLGLGAQAGSGESPPQFQFLSRNSVRWDTDYAATYAKDVGGFQFLSRNSVRWDQDGPAANHNHGDGFNSSVGILSVGTDVLILDDLGVQYVSIPQSEFCPLGQMRRDATRRLL